MRKFDKAINIDSKMYLNKFLLADKIISSVAVPWVFNPFDIDEKYIRDLYHFDFIFLQSGIIKDDLSKFYNILIKISIYSLHHQIRNIIQF